LPFPVLSLHCSRRASIRFLSRGSNSFAAGVGHPKQSLSLVRRADAVCAQNNRPDGVAFGFHVCRYSIEPTVPNCACSLLAKDCVRAALADEPVHRGPEVPLVGVAPAFARCRERLTRARSGPDWSIVWPSGESKSEGPAANAGEEMDLSVFFDVIGRHLLDRFFQHG